MKNEQNKPKLFKISVGLKEEIKRILTRSEIPFRLMNKDDQWYCATNLSGEKFHKIVQRAKCEKKTKESGSLYLTYREGSNPLLAQSIMEQNKTTGFVLISKKTK